MQFPFLSRRAALALGLSLTTTLSVAALMTPGTARADDRPVVRVAVQQVVNSGALTPLREQSNVGARIFPMIFAPLIDLDRQGDLAPVPGLAESWKRIDDKTVELKLRQGATFHNGDEVTAEDVAFSFGKERMFGDKPPRRAGQDDKTIKSDDSKTLFTTTNTQTGPELPPEVPAIARRLWPSLERVEVVDKYTVRFVNAVPDVTMEGRLARMGSQIISKRAFLEAKDWMSWARNPVSAGPFKIKEFRPDNVLVLEAHDAYFNGKPTVREVRYTVVPEVPGRVNGLLSGEYDFASDIPPDQIATIEASDKFEVVGGPVLNHRLIVFDKNHPQLADPRIRQALTHAMDRQAIVEALWGGRTSVPKGLQWEYYADMFHADWSVPEYNPELAKKLVKESGYKGEPIPFRVTNNYYTNQVQTAQILTEMWRSVGLNVEIQMKENWQQIFDRNEPRAIRDWSNSAPFSDPVSSIVNQHGPNGQQQQVGEWTNEEFNKLSGVLETSTNHEERRKAFRRMLEIAEREDPAYTVLHRNVVFYGKRKDIEWKWSPTFAMDFRADNIRYKK
ncbi:ABC transporter substrate-binding protein [Oceanibaculum indicum]|uniref:Peptide/nickel transport system substrate-binding protein n=1 Tax=Oceanibaculum indicum TaxID=526216 RepID=A0A420WP93_9PROT|nr:ABC transporter substrate-binding protein [Oceanibaculum indicum]RKQ72837.1 peptide/nickel transport system substrate-binding protein [Oceanibaculum indicum]